MNYEGGAIATIHKGESGFSEDTFSFGAFEWTMKTVQDWYFLRDAQTSFDLVVGNFTQRFPSVYNEKDFALP